MSAEVAGIKQLLAVSLDLKGIGVIGRVIDQIRCHLEVAERHGCPVAKLQGVFGDIGSRQERCRRLKDAMGCGSQGDGQFLARKMRQPPVIEMPMRQDKRPKRVLSVQAVDSGMNGNILWIAIQGQAQIKQKPFTTSF